MPFLHHSSSIRARNAHAALRLHVRHSLLAGELIDAHASEQCCESYDLKRPLPAAVDVFSHSDLAFLISTTVNGCRVNGTSTHHSIIFRHLVHMLRNNATLLCINNISKGFIDDQSDFVKVHVTPQRSVPPENPKSQIALTSIHLVYHLKTTYESDIDTLSVDPSSILELLNQVVNKLITHHVLKRYPLVFGPWGERLQLEKTYFPSIVSSLFSMARRSPNMEFRRQFKRYSKVLRKCLRTLECNAINDIQESCKGPPDESVVFVEASIKQFSDEEVLSASMQQLCKLALRPSIVHCENVGEDTVVLDDNDEFQSLLPCGEEGDVHVDLLSPLESDDPILATVQDDDCLIDDDSELEDNSSSRTGIDWTFMSRLPFPTNVEADTFGMRISSTTDDGDYLKAHRTSVYSKKTRNYLPLPHDYKDVSRNFASASGTEQAYSDFSDSETDSLSLSFLEEHCSSTLPPADGGAVSLIADSSRTHSGCASSTHKFAEAGSEMYQAGQKEATSTYVVSTDQPGLQSSSVTDSLALPPQGADQAPAGYRGMSRSRSSYLDSNLSTVDPFSPFSIADLVSCRSVVTSGCSPLLSDLVPIADLRFSSPIFYPDSMSEIKRGPGRAEDDWKTRDVQLCKTREEPFLSSHLHSWDTVCLPDDDAFSPLSRNFTRSGDRIAEREASAARVRSESPELHYGAYILEARTVSDFVSNAEDELSMESDDDGSTHALESSSSERLGCEVDMDVILESDEEREGEYEWSLIA